MAHGIPRETWVSRFRRRIEVQAGLYGSPFVNSIVEGELESWPDEPNGDWLDSTPEEAADENLSCWSE